MPTTGRGGTRLPCRPLIAIAVCFAVWATPRSIISTVSEVRAMGGSDTPWEKAYMNYRAWNFSGMTPNAAEP